MEKVSPQENRFAKILELNVLRVHPERRKRDLPKGPRRKGQHACRNNVLDKIAAESRQHVQHGQHDAGVVDKARHGQVGAKLQVSAERPSLEKNSTAIDNVDTHVIGSESE